MLSSVKSGNKVLPFPPEPVTGRIGQLFVNLCGPRRRKKSSKAYDKTIATGGGKKPAQAAAGQIRIIGGQWRGRKLPVPSSPGLRPTTDRVRETLFNWLAPVIQGARCLDCFAGSGALGLEALSRYAGSATLLEYERPVAQQLEKTWRCCRAKERWSIPIR